MLTTALLIILALIAALLIYASTRPDTFQVQRAATINAPPEQVFALINDYRAWGAWSPWAHKDPAVQHTFGSITSGAGATYAWAGNKKVGKGSMTMLESLPPSKIVIKLDFEKPFEAHNTVTFTLTPEGGATHVNWKMEGPSPYLTKVMGVLCNMDKMVGKDFEAGLTAMKSAAEK